jgi:hypothetical protein
MQMEGVRRYGLRMRREGEGWRDGLLGDVMDGLTRSKHVK